MENLKKSLEQLHIELKKAKSIDAASEKILLDLMNDIHSLIARSESKEDEKHNLLAGLKESAQKFEISHPELAKSIEIVINSLSNIGA
jgi:predicted  nucleic acid-binding Zn-ribbon protein